MAPNRPPTPPAWPDQTVPDWLTRRVELAPDGLALLAGEAHLSFAELDARATDTARRLATLGVRPGKPLALLCRNGPRFVEVVHACIKLGAVLVPLNTRLTAPELAFQVGDVGAELLVHDAAHAELAAQVQAAAPNLRLAGPEELDAVDLAVTVLRERVELDVPHCVIYTSGTSGRP